MERKNDFTLVMLVTALPLMIIGGMLFFVARNHTAEVATKGEDDLSAEGVPLIEPLKPFPTPTLKAKGAIVYNATTDKVLYEKNSTLALPLASITKLMTALVASEIAPPYSLITLDKDSLSEVGDSGLRPNEIWKLKDLLDFTLTVSSNDGARAIATAIGAWQQPGTVASTDDPRKTFVALMETKARSLGLSQTHFSNETGLDLDAETPGAEGSAQDVARLVAHIMKKNPTLLAATKNEKIEVQSGSLIAHNASNTNEALSKIPGLIASKTGYTDLAGGNLTVAFETGAGANKTTIILVVLGSTMEGRFEDIEVLASTTEKYLSNIR